MGETRQQQQLQERKQRRVEQSRSRSSWKGSFFLILFVMRETSLSLSLSLCLTFLRHFLSTTLLTRFPRRTACRVACPMDALHRVATPCAALHALHLNVSVSGFTLVVFGNSTGGCEVDSGEGAYDEGEVSVGERCVDRADVQRQRKERGDPPCSVGCHDVEDDCRSWHRAVQEDLAEKKTK